MGKCPWPILRHRPRTASGSGIEPSKYKQDCEVLSLREDTPNDNRRRTCTCHVTATHLKTGGRGPPHLVSNGHWVISPEEEDKLCWSLECVELYLHAPLTSFTAWCFYLETCRYIGEWEAAYSLKGGRGQVLGWQRWTKLDARLTPSFG